MPLRLIVMTAAAALAPAVSATPNFRVLLNVEHVEVVPRSEDQTVYLDVFLTDLDNVNEKLLFAAVLLHGPENTPDGVRFAPTIPLPHSSDAHPYAFRNAGADEPHPALAEFGRLGVFAGSVQVPNEGVDISELRSGLFSVPVLVPAAARPGIYPVVVDPAFTEFDSSAVANIIPVIGAPGGVTVVPEPAAALAAAALAAPALLRRRRRR